VVLAVFLASRVFAQDLTPPPPPPPMEPAPAEAVATDPVPPPVEDQTWSSRCLARPTGYYGPRLWIPRPTIAVSEPIVVSGSGAHGAQPPSKSGGSGLSGGGGGGKDAAVLLLVAAVVVVAALPVIFYALDEEAPPDVVGRFHCPSFEVDVAGGLETDPVSGPSVPMSVRAKASLSWFSVVAQFDVSPWTETRRLLDSRVAAVVRFTPRQKVELGISVGYRSLTLRDEWRPGFEAALPHEYVFWRDGAAHLGLEVRPAVFVWQRGVDVGLDVGLRIPLGQVFSLNVSGRLFSVDALTRVGAGAQAGVGLKI
jgi:hypothetical protein